MVGLRTGTVGPSGHTAIRRRKHFNCTGADLVPEDERAAHGEVVGRIARGEDVSSFETRRVTKDGGLLDVWLTVTRLADDRGNPIAIATTERDVTNESGLSLPFQTPNASCRSALSRRVSPTRLIIRLVRRFFAAESALHIAAKRDPTDQVAVGLQTITIALERARHTVRNILKLSRNDPGEKIVCDLNQIVWRACDVLRPYARQRLRNRRTAHRRHAAHDSRESLGDRNGHRQPRAQCNRIEG